MKSDEARTEHGLLSTGLTNIPFCKPRVRAKGTFHNRLIIRWQQTLTKTIHAIYKVI